MIPSRSIFLLLALLVTCGAVEPVPKTSPRTKARIVCFNGKPDSRSSCSITNFQKDGVIHAKGKMRCGFPGHVSEIEWLFVEQRGNRDVYRFTRRYPIDTAEVVTTTKHVELSDRRIVVFEDDSQTIVVEPPGK